MLALVFVWSPNHLGRKEDPLNTSHVVIYSFMLIEIDLKGHT